MVESRPEVLALIPARGGSKGIPRKNLRDFAGAPLIAYSIVAGLRAQPVTRVIVTTDDEEIAACARQWGAEVPFLRPADLALDHTQDYPVFQHALEWLAQNEDYHPEIVVQLRPTSPIRPPHLVDDAVSLLLKHPDADSVRGVIPSGENPYKMWRIDEYSGALKPLLHIAGLKEPYNTPRQELPVTYWQTGHIDAMRASSILEKKSLTGDVILPILIDPRYTVDIDFPEDLERYATLMQDTTLEKVDPLSKRRAFPTRVSTLIMDFDGVLTDDMVYTDQQGKETVRTSRSDGMGLGMVKAQAGVTALIISRESNPVVAARAKKLGLEVYSGIMSKDEVVKQLIAERKLDPSEIVYVGNDLPDLTVLPLVGFFACPADARPQVIRQADLVLKHIGGQGAIRELTDRILGY